VHLKTRFNSNSNWERYSHSISNRPRI